MRVALPRLPVKRVLVDSGAFDPWLVAALVALICLGLVMVTSASLPIATRFHGDGLYYLKRQLLVMVAGAGAAAVLFRFGLERLMQHSKLVLCIALILLVAVYVPGLGRRVNGSLRWVNLGLFTIQASEFAKLAFIVYLAGYVVRFRDQLESSFKGFIKPLVVLFIFGALLMGEPDMGTTVVLAGTFAAMLWLGGLPVWIVGLFAIAGSAFMALLVKIEPYRMTRFVTYLDPWVDERGKGYQLTQSLIAFGRGEWWGVGLGNSIQKHFYLPEVHTDFIFAVIGEELGLAGVLCVLSLFLFLVWRLFRVGARAEAAGLSYGANLVYGFAALIGIEAFINMGVSMGALPTKGLTLPFISYGNNSNFILCCAFGLIFRVAWDSRPQRESAARAPVPASPPMESSQVPEHVHA